MYIAFFVYKLIFLNLKNQNIIIFLFLNISLLLYLILNLKKNNFFLKMYTTILH